jgi:hypothetical protein
LPWDLTDLTVKGSGLVRNAIFSDTNNNLNNLNGTMLVAKLNSHHLGIFVSGVMKVEYLNVNGHSDPHAEDNLTQALLDTFAALKTNGFLFDSRTNVLSIKISKSPCTRCSATLAAFYNNVCKSRNIKIRIKIMKLYEGESTTEAARSIGDLTAAGIVCVPWRIEEKYAEAEEGQYTLIRHETKLGRSHELSNQSMTTDGMRLMQQRTSDLQRLAPLSSTAEYKGVKQPLSTQAIREEIASLKDRIAQCELSIQAEMNNQKVLRNKKKREQANLKAKRDRLNGREPSLHSAVANTLSRLENTTIPNIEKKISDADATLATLKMQREFLESHSRELESGLMGS